MKVGSLVKYVGNIPSIPGYECDPFTGLVLSMDTANEEALIFWKSGKTWEGVEYLEVLSESRGSSEETRAS